MLNFNSDSDDVMPRSTVVGPAFEGTLEELLRQEEERVRKNRRASLSSYQDESDENIGITAEIGSTTPTTVIPPLPIDKRPKLHAFQRSLAAGLKALKPSLSLSLPAVANENTEPKKRAFFKF